MRRTPPYEVAAGPQRSRKAERQRHERPGKSKNSLDRDTAVVGFMNRAMKAFFLCWRFSKKGFSKWMCRYRERFGQFWPS